MRPNDLTFFARLLLLALFALLVAHTPRASAQQVQIGGPGFGAQPNCAHPSPVAAFSL